MGTLAAELNVAVSRVGAKATSGFAAVLRSSRGDAPAVHARHRARHPRRGASAGAKTQLIGQLEEEFRYLTRKNRIEMRLTRERVRDGDLSVR